MGKGKDLSDLRERSKQQARESSDQARDARQSHQPGVDDDSEIVQSLVGTLAAPIEGTLEGMDERRERAGHGQDIGNDQVGGISGQRPQDVARTDERPAQEPNAQQSGQRGRIPQRPEDAEADPREIAEDMTRDRPGARAKR